MCADASFHADQAGRYIGEPRFDLATRPLLPQHDGAARIVAHDVERVLADIDADHGDRSIGCLRHGVLLVFGAPCQLSCWRGRSTGGPSHLKTSRTSSPACAFRAIAESSGSYFLPLACSAATSATASRQELHAINLAYHAQKKA